MLTRYERTQQLAKIGLNTPYYILIRTPTDIWKLKQFPFWTLQTQKPKYINKHKQTKINQNLQRIKAIAKIFNIKTSTYQNLPYFPYVSRADALILANSIVDCGLEILAYKGINPEDMYLSGIAKVTSEDITLEASYRTSVQKVTEDKEIDVKVKLREEEKLNCVFKEIFQMINKHREKLNDKILEFSYYKVPVGRLNQKLIFWDYSLRLNLNKKTRLPYPKTVKNQPSSNIKEPEE